MINQTKQQRLIIESDANVIKVKAFAGSGKSSTLAAAAKARPKQKMLYIAFNKSVQLEAARKFPSNVSVRTVSSIAYQAVGKDYASKLINNITTYTLMNNFDLRINAGPSRNNQAIYALRISEAINRFVSSDDDAFDLSHIKFLNTPTEKDFSEVAAVKLCENIWYAMCDKNATKIGMTHDGYLKLYRQSGGNFNNYDVVLLDEAQDSNPVTIAMFNEAQAKKIIVGDPHQSIYQFRGAVNAMDLIEADANFILTKCFRFGDRISMLANAILHTKGESDILVGHGREETPKSHVNKYEQHAFLARSNSTLFMRAASSLRAKKSIHLVGGTAGYRLDLIRDAYYLKIREKSLIKNPFIKNFDSFDTMTEFSDSSLDPEMKMLVRVINDMERQDVSAVIDQIITAQTQDANKADIVLSTAHKAKGLEFDNVILDDYFQVSKNVERYDKYGKKLPDMVVPSSAEEINLTYVAATRAKKVLECPALSAQLLQYEIAVKNKMLNNTVNQYFIEQEELLKESLVINTLPVMAVSNEKTSEIHRVKIIAGPKTIPVHERKEKVSEVRKKMHRL